MLSMVKLFSQEALITMEYFESAKVPAMLTELKVFCLCSDFRLNSIASYWLSALGRAGSMTGRTGLKLQQFAAQFYMKCSSQKDFWQHYHNT